MELNKVKINVCTHTHTHEDVIYACEEMNIFGNDYTDNQPNIFYKHAASFFHVGH